MSLERHGFIKTTCLAGFGIFLYVALLLAISPYPSSAATNLSEWLFRTGETPVVPAGDALFHPLPRLALVEKAIAPTKLEYAGKLFGVIETIFRIAALIVGGLFAYWKFFRGRTFHPRLEPAVTATARTEADQVFLNVSCKLKNVGLSSVDLDPAISFVRIWLQDIEPGAKPAEIQWPEDQEPEETEFLSVDVFQDHEWIEGGETIEDAHLFIFPHVPNQACRVDLQVFRTQRTVGERIREWKRRRKGPNAWAHHAILDQFISETPAQEPTTKEIK
jgi:hypothetical protein